MILREQVGLLLGLYWNPVKAASRIIDEGRLWFALMAAVLALASVQAGYVIPTVKDLLYTGRDIEALARPIVNTDTPGSKFIRETDYKLVDAYFQRLTSMRPLAAWIYLADSSTIAKLLLALAIGFVPGAILVATLRRSHESFGVRLRKDFGPLLNCVLMSLAVVYLPYALFSTVLRFAGRTLPLQYGLLPLACFIFLAICCTRTLWGTGYVVAAGSAAAGLVVATGAMMGAFVLGRFAYYLASPCVLYYGYLFLRSDMNALGGGLLGRINLRRQLEIATGNPHDADANYQLGLIYHERHQYDEARKRYLRAIEIDSHEAEPRFQLGKISLEEGKFDEAIGFLSSAAKLDDKCGSHEVWRELGRAYLKNSRPEESCSALAKYIERRPYDPEGLYWQGEAMLAAGSGAEAKQAFSECRAAVDTMPPHRRRQVSRWGRMASSKLRALD